MHYYPAVSIASRPSQRLIWAGAQIWRECNEKRSSDCETPSWINMISPTCLGLHSFQGFLYFQRKWLAVEWYCKLDFYLLCFLGFIAFSRDDFNIKVLQAFVELHEFADLNLVQALRSGERLTQISSGEGGIIISTVNCIVRTLRIVIAGSSCGVSACPARRRRSTVWWRPLLRGTVSATLEFSSRQVRGTTCVWCGVNQWFPYIQDFSNQIFQINKLFFWHHFFFFYPSGKWKENVKSNTQKSSNLMCLQIYCLSDGLFLLMHFNH